MPKNRGKNRFSDADRQKPISYSCSTPQITFNKKNTLFMYFNWTFTRIFLIKKSLKLAYSI